MDFYLSITVTTCLGAWFLHTSHDKARKDKWSRTSPHYARDRKRSFAGRGRNVAMPGDFQHQPKRQPSVPCWLGTLPQPHVGMQPVVRAHGLDPGRLVYLSHEVCQVLHSSQMWLWFPWNRQMIWDAAGRSSCEGHLALRLASVRPKW